MRKLFLFVMAAMWAAVMWAVPVRPGLYRMEKQPDGTEVKVFIHGDEWFNYETDSLDNVFERDTKGHLKRDARGFLINTHKKMTDEYAQQQWQTARRKMQEQNGPRKAVGTPREIPRVLVILVEFPDTTFHKGNRTKKDWDDFFNKEGYNYNGAIGSVRDYFIAQSGGKYKPQFDVVGPVTALNKWKYYDYDTQGVFTPVKSLTRDVCDMVDEEVDFTKYDADNDGKIDLIALIYAGYGYSETGIGIWPHHSFASGEFDGKQLSEYCCTSELSYLHKRSYIGHFCHEFSHALGMPDYYVGCGSANYYSVPWRWSLMAFGDYLPSPPNYSIFDKYYMGWDTPKVLKLGESVTLKPSEAYVVTRDGKMPTYNHPDTVYYLENRQQTGMDKYAPGHGLLIWRVIFDQDEWEGNNVNFVNNLLRVKVIPSQGTSFVSHDNAEEVYQTFPGPAKTTSQLLFSYHLRNIKEDNEGNITFTTTTPFSLTARQQDNFNIIRAGKLWEVQSLFSTSPNVLYLHKIDLKLEVSGDDDTSFELQYAPHIYKSESNPTFTGIQSFSATKKQMQKGFVWQTEDKIEKKNTSNYDYIQYRIKATTTVGGYKKEFYSDTVKICILYRLKFNTTYLWGGEWDIAAGTKVTKYMPFECSWLEQDEGEQAPIEVERKDDSIVFTMPPYPIDLLYNKISQYEVCYYDWDGKCFGTKKVKCPLTEEGIALESTYTPSREGYDFIGWSEPTPHVQYVGGQAYYNVGWNVDVHAKYSKSGARDTYEIELVSHETEEYPYYNYIKEQNPFKNNPSMAMVRDRLTFRFNHTATDAGKVYFWFTSTFDKDGSPVFSESGTEVTSLTKEEALSDKEVLYTYDLCNAPGCADEKTYAGRMAYKFRYVTESLVYDTPPMMFDIYYPQFIKAKVSDVLEISVKPKGYKFEYPTLPNDGEKVGDYIYTMVPAQYGDTVYLYGSDNYNTEDCLNFKRLRFKTWPSVATDISEDGTIYYAVEGFTDTIQITKAIYEVHFKYRKSDGEGSYYPYDDVQYVPCGSSASMPSLEDINYDPEIHPFTEWLCENIPDDRRWMNVHEELYYDAYYDYKPGPVYYTVTFVDWKGDVIGEPQKVLEYEDAVAPEPPTREGFHFTHWDKSFTNVQTDKTVTALYGQDGVTWTVTYRDYNDDLLGTETVPDGGDAVADVFVYRTGHQFRAWDAILTNIHHDIIADAQYEKVDIPLHIVNIIAEGGKVEVSPKQVELDKVNHGTVLELTAVPNEHYEFRGWEGYSPIYGLVVTENMTVIAKFTIMTYTVTFVDWDGTELKKETVEHGGDAKGPDTNPTREGYKFTGWSKPLTNITGDMIVIALYEQNPPTGVENTEYRIQNTDKILRDGHLYILVGDRIYDATGRLVK